MQAPPPGTKILLLAALFFASHLPSRGADPIFKDGAYHVHPGEEIQPALEAAAKDPENKLVKVHAGTYRPARPAFALVWFSHYHDGVKLEAVGEVLLTAGNPEIADPEAASFPAVVNHVVYFGDGISRDTVLKGFRITGANNFLFPNPDPAALESRLNQLRQTEPYYGNLFFFTDGGAIKIFGRSYPTLDRLEIFNNYSSPCAGGISVEHRGFARNSVLITNCIFRNNRADVTGSALDLLRGSAAEVRNCLFIGNISNASEGYSPVKGNMEWPNLKEVMAQTFGYLPEHGSGALTVFPLSHAIVDRATFTGNWNGVDDRSLKSQYKNSIFWMNKASGGHRPGKRYEFDISRRFGVTNCFISGEINDLNSRIDPEQNRIPCPDPQFNEHFVPRNPEFAEVGYRPPARPD